MTQFRISEPAEAILDILGDAIDLADVGILLLDRNLRIQFINRRLVEFFELPPDLVATWPTFRDLLNYTEITSIGEPASDDLLALLDLREAAVRAGSIRQTRLTLRNGRRLLSSCTACGHGGRILIYTDISRELQHEAELVADRTAAEMRFSSELLEQQAAYLATIAEEAEESGRKIEAARLALEQEIAERCQLEAQLRHLATTDGLTGALNRAGFMAMAERAMERPCRLGRQHAVLVLDVDHFKTINDQHGHAGGDLALQHLVATLRAGVRQIDLLGRLGGEEFAVVLPDATPGLADRMAERLRGQVAAAPVSYGDRLIEMTVSVGVATKHTSDQTFGQLLARADNALYQAKDSGRSRVVWDYLGVAAEGIATRRDGRCRRCPVAARKSVTERGKRWPPAAEATAAYAIIRSTIRRGSPGTSLAAAAAAVRPSSRAGRATP